MKIDFSTFVTNKTTILVSHTDHDLVFIWNVTDPLVVNPEIELPQLDISNNYTDDCTIEYSTGYNTTIINFSRKKKYCCR